MKEDLKAIFTIALLYFIIELLGVTCPIKFLTGISCAGCGMSRAWLSVLHGDISKAFYYHPLFWMMIPICIIFLIHKKLSSNCKKWLIAIFVSAFLAVYIIRLTLFPDNIVCFRPSDGFIEQRLYNFYQLLVTHIT